MGDFAARFSIYDGLQKGRKGPRSNSCCRYYLNCTIVTNDAICGCNHFQRGRLNTSSQVASGPSHLVALLAIYLAVTRYRVYPCRRRTSIQGKGSLVLNDGVFRERKELINGIFWFFFDILSIQWFCIRHQHTGSCL